MDRSVGDVATLGGGEERREGYALSAGQVLGQYRILRALGRGGMGEVYEAENTVNRKHVALKVLPRAATGGTFVERFKIESRVMMDLRHPHIVQVHHAGEEGGLYYLTMDLVVGPDGEPRSLEERLKEEGGKLKEEEVKRIALQILDALEYAHKRGVVHRDLKPANVLLDEEGNVRVTDFGLAKVIGADYLQSVIQRSVQLSLSMGGADAVDTAQTLLRPEGFGGQARVQVSSSARALLGTYDYMAPEQKAGGEITPQTDIYAFGVMLYRMLTGRKPEGMPKPPSRYGRSVGWDGIVSRCLEPDPKDRFASAAELKAVVQAVGRGLGSRRLVLAGVAALVALAAGLWWAAGQRGQSSPTSRTTPPVAGPSVSPLVPAPVAPPPPPSDPAGEEIAAAEAALGQNDLETAQTALEAAEARSAGSAAVAALRGRLVEEWRKEAMAAQAAAEAVWRQVAVLNRADGVGVRVDECRAAMEGARRLMEARQYREAAKVYAAAREAMNGVLTLAAQRDAAVGERDRAASARIRAEAAGGAELGGEDWAAAERDRAGAERAFSQAQFESALESWRAAAAAYARAEQTAARNRAARDAANTARAEAEAARGKAVAANAERDAAADWRNAETAREAAQAAFNGGDFATAQTRWREATVAYARAEQSARAAQETARREAEARARQRQKGQDFVLEPPGLTMKWIPAGRFRMGSTKAERDWAAGPEGKGQADWYTDERNPVEVRIAEGFWMGQTEVTRGQFRRFVEATGYRTEAERTGKAWTHNLQSGSWEETSGVSWRNPGFEQNDSHPAVCITWNDAMKFCEWLTGVEREAGRLPEGYEYRLPGEAEWEYACRGGREGTKFWWGDSLNEGRGRLNGAGADRLPNGAQWTFRYDWEDGFAYTSPVDHYGARGRNGFDLADMLGNVWEWCYDGYDGNGPHAQIWQGDTSRRVLRGGSFDDHPGDLRCADRGWLPPSKPNAYYGVRVVLGVIVR